MALINCPECNKEISDKAMTCPNCGYPVQEINKPKFSPTGMNVCPKCGKFNRRIEKCPDCGTAMMDCHYTTTDYDNLSLTELSNWEQQMREKYVVNSPELDEVLYNKRLQEEKAEEEYYASIPTKPSEPKITCPYCKATNIRKIGIVSRSVSAGIFGLGSKKIGKQWHCDHCGSDF